MYASTSIDGLTPAEKGYFAPLLVMFMKTDPHIIYSTLHKSISEHQMRQPQLPQNHVLILSLHLKQTQLGMMATSLLLAPGRQRQVGGLPSLIHIELQAS